MKVAKLSIAGEGREVSPELFDKLTLAGVADSIIYLSFLSSIILDWMPSLPMADLCLLIIALSGLSQAATEQRIQNYVDDFRDRSGDTSYLSLDDFLSSLVKSYTIEFICSLRSLSCMEILSPVVLRARSQLSRCGKRVIQIAPELAIFSSVSLLKDNISIQLSEHWGSEMGFVLRLFLEQKNNQVKSSELYHESRANLGP